VGLPVAQVPHAGLYCATGTDRDVGVGAIPERRGPGCPRPEAGSEFLGPEDLSRRRHCLCVGVPFRCRVGGANTRPW